jgi:hypothetical protein
MRARSSSQHLDVLIPAPRKKRRRSEITIQWTRTEPKVRVMRQTKGGKQKAYRDKQLSKTESDITGT